MNLQLNDPLEVWGGIECTINRVGDSYFDQLDYSGHFDRNGDIALLSGLGIKKMRYPVLWEKHQPDEAGNIDWSAVSQRLGQLKIKQIDVIAGLVHHGSGPRFVEMIEDSFAEKLAVYAGKVAGQFPWINYYTPVNEPLTTARFCGLYGLWYPHHCDDASFCRILINECKGTVLAMQEIRKVNPGAKLVQTEDLGKIHSTPLLRYQADFENHRRWLSFDLLCGSVNSQHPMWNYLTGSGVSESELNFFLGSPCVPDVIGINHYLTSERYLDEDIEAYPAHTRGGNGRHQYADVEAVRVGSICPDGPYKLLKAAWDRCQLPIAVTEVHLFCTREEQMRWLQEVWEAAHKLKKEGANIMAVTPWAMLGSFGWNHLLTAPKGDYEQGTFDLASGRPRPTILTRMIRSYGEQKDYVHPVLDQQGWWMRNSRVIYGTEKIFCSQQHSANAQPLLIVGKTGSLGTAFSHLCTQRGIYFVATDRSEINIIDKGCIQAAIIKYDPWAIINTAGFVQVDNAEHQAGRCLAINTAGAENLAVCCEAMGVKLLTYSSDLVFDGLKKTAYTEKDEGAPLNIYGRSKSLAEKHVLQQNPSALVVRTSAFFGPWDQYNFVSVTLQQLKGERAMNAINDVIISPTYLPDLVNTSLDLLLDDESGIWHLSNSGETSWAELALNIAERSGLKTSLVKPEPLKNFNFRARRPLFSALQSERGGLLPTLESALDHCLQLIL